MDPYKQLLLEVVIRNASRTATKMILIAKTTAIVFVTGIPEKPAGFSKSKHCNAVRRNP
jgi:hypothetical protein